MIRNMLMLCGCFLLTGCLELYSTANVVNDDINLAVTLKRYNLAYYDEPEPTGMEADTHTHTNDHCHDQNDECTQTNPSPKYFHSLYISVNLLNKPYDYNKSYSDGARTIGVDENDRLIAEVNGVRFELFRGGKSSLEFGSDVQVAYSFHSAIIDSRYHPEVFFSAIVDGGTQKEIDYEDLDVRFLLERKDGSVSEARVSYSSSADAVISEINLNSYTSKLVAQALYPSITHVDILDESGTAQQQEEYSQNSSGDYLTTMITPDQAWAAGPISNFQPHDNIDLYCHSFYGDRSYDYEDGYLAIGEVASIGQITIDTLVDINESTPCENGEVKFFKVDQKNTWLVEKNDFSTVRFSPHSETRSVRQILIK